MQLMQVHCVVERLRDIMIMMMAMMAFFDNSAFHPFEVDK